jgi:hypothetical protein
VKGFKIIALTGAGSYALPHLEKVNLPYVLTRDSDGNPMDITFTFTGRLKLFVKPGDIKTVIGSVMKLYGAYEEADYNLEFL